MKNFLLFWIIIASISVCCWDSSYKIEQKNKLQIQIAIYPTGTTGETYYFVLNTNNKLIVEKGVRTGNDLTQKPFIKDGVKFEKTLTSYQTNKIIDLTNRICNDDRITNTQTVKDSWIIQIIYKNKNIRHDVFRNDSHQIKELLDEIINISPIEVDLHGWS